MPEQIQITIIFIRRIAQKNHNKRLIEGFRHDHRTLL